MNTRIPKRPAAATPALRLLQREGVAHVVHSFAHDPATELPFGLEAAAALDVDAKRIYKTLLTDVDNVLTVAILPVSDHLDLKALAVAAGGRRAKIADSTLAERTTGYVIGGISPFGQRKRLPTVVDESATAHRTVLVSAGRRGLEVEVDPGDLISLTSATVALVRRDV